jgi:hypothetical protein
MMELTRLCVVCPRLCDSQAYIVLRVMDGLKVFRNLGFDKVPKFGHHLTAEKRVVCRSLIAHVRPCFLALDERQFFCGQITL